MSVHDIADIKEFSILLLCEENGSPVENVMEILPFKRCDAESILYTLIEWVKMKCIQCQRWLGWVLMMHQHLQESIQEFKHN